MVFRDRGPLGPLMNHCWERATPVALMGGVIRKDASLEWRAPSKDEDHDAGLEARGPARETKTL
jgi:hypothetical protein